MFFYLIGIIISIMIMMKNGELIKEKEINFSTRVSLFHGEFLSLD